MCEVRLLGRTRSSYDCGGGEREKGIQLAGGLVVALAAWIPRSKACPSRAANTKQTRVYCERQAGCRLRFGLHRWDPQNMHVLGEMKVGTGREVESSVREPSERNTMQVRARRSWRPTARCAWQPHRVLLLFYHTKSIVVKNPDLSPPFAKRGHETEEAGRGREQPTGWLKYVSASGCLGGTRQPEPAWSMACLHQTQSDFLEERKELSSRDSRTKKTNHRPLLQLTCRSRESNPTFMRNERKS
ncbi:expressed unknown protein [Seminavis robusta]|uniref:Uncharacterized protein n=1 Tax=Seminavis robusta TaxID=568900 RepID=A0A9N8EK58_9STRA|nr:expressed unknown protein [Seminavis robusta]|eukprot:Sro1240_g255341.1  (244) ;mRNA; f:22784-23515